MTVRVIPAASGGWLAIVGRDRFLLVESTIDAAVLDEAWDSIAHPEMFQRTIDLLTRSGLGSTPPFVLADLAGGVRILSRGTAKSTVTTSAGDLAVDASGVSTWVERHFPDASAVSVSIPGAGRATELALPVETGVSLVAELVASTVGSVSPAALVTSRSELLGRRAAHLTLALTACVVTALLLVAANLVILLTSGAEPNALDTYRSNAWLQWRGRFSIVLPWWVFLVLAAGWTIVLRMVWHPENTYVRMAGPVRMMASPFVVGALSILSAGITTTWAFWYYSTGWAWYLLPVASLLVIAIVAFYRDRAMGKRLARSPSNRRRTAAGLGKDVA